MAPIDFLVFGLIVMGGTCGFSFTSHMEELAVPATAAFIYCAKNLLVLGLPELMFEPVNLTGDCLLMVNISFFISS